MVQGRLMDTRCEMSQLGRLRRPACQETDQWGGWLFKLCNPFTEPFPINDALKNQQALCAPRDHFSIWIIQGRQ